jgi:hypothetical protein
MKKKKSGSYDFRKTEFIKHTDEYKRRRDDYNELQGEYDPTTEHGKQRLKELADFERKVLPCGNTTLLGQIYCAGKIDIQTAEYANFGHIYSKIGKLRKDRSSKIDREKNYLMHTQDGKALKEKIDLND